jgi:hypothetical protein
LRGLPLIVIFFIIGYNNSLSLPFSVGPFPLKCSSVCCIILSDPMLSIISVLALVSGTIEPFVDSSAVLHTVFKVSLEGLSIFVDNLPMSIELVVLKPTLIREVISDVFSVPVLESIQKPSFVKYLMTIFSPDLDSLAIRQVSSPLTLILKLYPGVSEGAVTLCLLVL